MDPAPDPIDAVALFLKAATNTTVFNTEIPASVTARQPEPDPMMLVRPAGGGSIGRAWQEYGDVRVDLWCFAASPKAARSLYLLALPALKGLTREKHGDVLLHWARRSGGPTPGRDPDTKWPFTFSTWQLLVAEVPS